MPSLFDPEFPPIEINPKEIIEQVEKNIHARIFMAVFFMIAQSWKLNWIKIELSWQGNKCIYMYIYRYVYTGIYADVKNGHSLNTKLQ